MRKLAQLGCLGVGLVALGAAAYLIGLQVTGNFHVVIPGELYRSAQPSAGQLQQYIEKYGIRTVINLRGRSEERWYSDEVAASEELGLTHVDFAMSSSKLFSAGSTRELIAILRNVPKPVLIHCKSGSDRTGLASVIYLQQIAGVDEHIAEKQLSIRFGHIGVPLLSPTFAMDESWEILEEAFGLAS